MYRCAVLIRKRVCLRVSWVEFLKCLYNLGDREFCGSIVFSHSRVSWRVKFCQGRICFIHGVH